MIKQEDVERNRRVMKGTKAFLWAIYQNDLQKVKELVEKNRQLLQQSFHYFDEEACHLLMLPIWRKNVDILKWLFGLLSKEQKKAILETLIRFALLVDHFDIMTFLLKTYEQIFQNKAPYGASKLKSACYRRRFQNIKALALHEPKWLGVQDPSRKVPMIYGNFEVVDFLLNLFPNQLYLFGNEADLLFNMVAKGRLQCLKRLQKEGLPIDLKDKCNDTTLHQALSLRSSDLDMMRYLLSYPELKKEINTQNYFGETPIHLAIRKARSLDMVKLLLRHGADPTIQDHKGQDALSLANKKNLPKTIRFLTKYLQGFKEGKKVDLSIRKPKKALWPEGQFNEVRVIHVSKNMPYESYQHRKQFLGKIGYIPRCSMKETEASLIYEVVFHDWDKKPKLIFENETEWTNNLHEKGGFELENLWGWGRFRESELELTGNSFKQDPADCVKFGEQGYGYLIDLNSVGVPLCTYVRNQQEEEKYFSIYLEALHEV